jgi:hypothetical protein
VTPSLEELAAALRAMGCPPDKSAEMASQLDKRAQQLAKLKGKTYDEALSHLLALMARGWAAQERMAGGLNGGAPNPPQKGS